MLRPLSSAVLKHRAAGDTALQHARLHRHDSRSARQLHAAAGLIDDHGDAITLVFLGRRDIPGIRNGTVMTVEATVGKHHGLLAMINPLYEILSVSVASDRP